MSADHSMGNGKVTAEKIKGLTQSKTRTAMPQKSVVGDVINFRGLVYGPVNEMGVVALFAKISEELGFIIEEVKAGFPDCYARRQIQKGWERLAIEFEFCSSNFCRHGHDANGCDIIVCWEHDWDICPVPVLSLKQYLADAQAKVSSPLKRVRIADPVQIRRSKLTDGCIKNGYINIKPIDDFWPEECLGENIKLAEKRLIVEYQGVGRVSTDISGRHKSLRAASSITKEFFEKHRLTAGDDVEIIRLAPFEYRIRPSK
jgi:hypothetical protein